MLHRPGVGFGDKKTYDNAGKYIKNDDFRNYYLSSRGAKKDLWENIEKLESVEKINMFFSDMEERRKVLEELKILKTSKVVFGDAEQYRDKPFRSKQRKCT